MESIQEKAINVIYCDFQKTFDKVSHKELLSIITSYGISGPLSMWITSFLKGRKQ